MLKLPLLPKVGDGPLLGISSSSYESRMGGKGKRGPELAPLTAPLRIGTAACGAWIGGRCISSIFSTVAVLDLGAKSGEVYGEDRREELLVVSASTFGKEMLPLLSSAKSGSCPKGPPMMELLLLLI
jgi:hypothetical protein